MQKVIVLDNNQSLLLMLY